jgi:hypothetical protein
VRAGSCPRRAPGSVRGGCGSQRRWGTSAQRSCPAVSAASSVATGPPPPASLPCPHRPGLVPEPAGGAVRGLTRAGDTHGTSEDGGASRGTLVVAHVSWGPWAPPGAGSSVYVKEPMAHRSCNFKSFHDPPSQLALMLGPRCPTGKVSKPLADQTWAEGDNCVPAGAVASTYSIA